jgi:hypothetical protein
VSAVALREAVEAFKAARERLTSVRLLFDPSQPRDEGGQWGEGGFGGGKKIAVPKPALRAPERAHLIKAEKDALRSAIDAHIKNPTAESAAALNEARDALREKRSVAGAADPDARMEGRGAAKKQRLLESANKAVTDDERDAAQRRVLDHVVANEGKEAFVEQAREFHADNTSPERLASVHADPSNIEGYYEDGKVDVKAARDVRSAMKAEITEHESALVERLEEHVGAGTARKLAKETRPSPKAIDKAAKDEIDAINSDPERLAKVNEAHEESKRYHSPEAQAEREAQKDREHDERVRRVDEAKSRGEKPDAGDVNAIYVHDQRKAKKNSQLEIPDPKVHARTARAMTARPRRSTRKPSSSGQMTLPISSRSLRLLAETLRGVSGDPEP